MSRTTLRGLGPITAFTAVAVLSACSKTYSIKPLLNPAQAQAPFGSRFSALGVDADGSMALSKTGSTTYFEGELKRGRYVLVKGDKSAGNHLSFYPIPNSEHKHLIQVTNDKDDKTLYAIGQAFKHRYAIDKFIIDDATWAAAKANKLAVTKDGANVTVKNRRSLLELARLYTQINFTRLSNYSNFSGKLFVFAKGDLQRRRLETRATVASCLAKAGHPHDPMVMALPSPHKFGVALVKIDTKKARFYCQRAIDLSGHASVRYAMVRINSRDKRYADIKAPLERLIKEKYPLAYVMKADLLFRGIGTRKDPEQALTVLRQGVATGSPTNRYYMGYFYMTKSLGKPNYGLARQQFIALLKDHDYRQAKTSLARLYEFGHGGPKDTKKAVQLYQQAAKAGDPVANLGLGRMLYFGTGIKKDTKEAYAKLKIAAAYGYSQAQYLSGFILSRGQGVKKNERSARTQFEAAQKQGHNDARAELGRLLYHGLGGAKDKVRGMKLMKTASQNGSRNASAYVKAIKPPATRYTRVPKKHKNDLNRVLTSGNKIAITLENQAFLGGLGSGMLKHCGVPANGSLRAEMQKFVLTIANGSLLGSNYSAKDVTKAWGSAAKQQTIFSSGVHVGKQIPCRIAGGASVRLVKALKASTRGADGGLSVFVKSCSPHFDKRRCQCLADTGRAVIPDIHKRHYRRSMIKSIIKRNPFIGLQIGVACQIGNY